MVMGHFKDVDYATWTDDLDLVSNDHYMMAHDPESHVELAFSADHTRGLAGGQAVDAHGVLHERGELAARERGKADQPAPPEHPRIYGCGADAVCFFQWRASPSGCGDVPLRDAAACRDRQAPWRSVVELGADLQRLAEVTGSTVESPVAIIVDYESWWAAELDAHPSALLAYRRTAESWYRSLWEANIPVDIVSRGADLTGYRVVLVPMLYLVRDTDVAALEAFTRAGGQVLRRSSRDRGRERPRLSRWLPRRVQGPPRDPFGGVQAVAGRAAGRLDGADLGTLTGTLWSEPVIPTDATVIATYTDGPSAGFAAITRVVRGQGQAWYVSTELDASGRRLVDAVCAAAHVTAPIGATAGVEVVVRRSADVEYVFAINHTHQDGSVDAEGTDLLTGQVHPAPALIPAGGVVVLRRRQ